MKELNESDRSAQVTISSCLHSGMSLRSDDPSGAGKTAAPPLKTEARKQNRFEHPTPLSGIISTDENPARLFLKGIRERVSTIPGSIWNPSEQSGFERKKAIPRENLTIPTDLGLPLPTRPRTGIAVFPPIDIRPYFDEVVAHNPESEAFLTPNKSPYLFYNLLWHYLCKVPFLVFFTNFFYNLYYSFFLVAIPNFERRHSFSTDEVLL
jgi:hypothetical protein